MKIKCAKCDFEDELTEDDVKLLGHIVRRFNNSPNPIDYISVLSIIKGKCQDGEKHAIMFHESFDQEIADIIAEY